MCGAFSIIITPHGLKYLIGLEAQKEWKPIYNARPGEMLPIFTQEKPKHATTALWNYVPHWMRDGKGKGVINARSESIETKPYFRGSIKTKRCVIPADGFYEWARQGKFKVPYRFVHKDGLPFAFAGLYDELPDDSGLGFVIITTTANALVGKVHDRMPVMFDREEKQAWLDPSLPVPEAVALLQPYPASKMRAFPVSRRVNVATNKDASVIEPVVGALTGKRR